MEVLIGRAFEAEWLRVAMDTDRPAVVVLEGEAGIGKSHLAAAVTGPRTRWWVDANPRAGRPAHGLRQMFAQAGDDRFDEVVAMHGDDGPDGRAALFDAVDSLVRQHRPDVIVIDDVQWADEPLLDWLGRADGVLRSAESSLLLTLRLPASAANVERAVQQLAAALPVQRRSLGPLDTSAVRALASSMGATCDRAKAEDLARRSAGNPLLVAELVQRGAVSQEALTGTARLHDLVSGRVLALTPGARQLLEALALAPQPAPVALLAEVCGLDDVADSQTWEEALRTGLVRTARGAVTFAHELHREAVEALVADPARGLLHRRIARALQGRPDATPLQVARQLVDAGDHPEAAEWLEQAADHSMRSHDHAAAVEILHEALTLAPRGDVALAARLLERLVRAARLTGRSADALDVLDDVRATLVVTAAAGHLYVAQARLRSFLDDYEGRAEALLSAERAFSRWSQPAGRVRVLAELAYPAGRTFTLAERVAFGRDGLAVASELGDDYEWSYCAANLALSLTNSGDAEGIALLEQACKRLDPASMQQRNELVRQQLNLAMTHLWAGSFTESSAMLAMTRRMVDEPFWNTATGFVEGVLLWRQGRWDDAMGLLRTAAAGGGVGAFRVGAAIAVAISFEQGDPVDLDDVGAAADDLIAADEHYWASLALALAVQLRGAHRVVNPARGALEQLRTLEHIGFRIGSQDLWPALAGAAPVVYDTAAPLLRAIRPAGPHAAACALLADGMHLSGMGATAAATAALEEAAAGFEAVGDVYALARANEVFSRAVATRSVAAVAARHAAQIYADIGAARSLTRHVRASRRHGLLTHYSIPESQRGRGAPGLTRREHEVALLAARGYTAAEIGAELVISPATVRKHLEHVKTKLGVRNKRDLVRMLNDLPTDIT